MSDQKEVIIFIDASSDEFDLLDEKNWVTLPVQKIRENLHQFVHSLSDAIQPLQNAAGDYDLESLTVAVGINGKGQVGFLGIGGEVGSTTTLTLTFKRRNLDS